MGATRPGSCGPGKRQSTSRRTGPAAAPESVSATVLITRFTTAIANRTIAESRLIWADQRRSNYRGLFEGERLYKHRRWP
jgi:hypothetical protein